MSTLFDETITIIRPAVKTFSNGFLSSGSESTFNVTGSLQPYTKSTENEVIGVGKYDNVSLVLMTDYTGTINTANVTSGLDADMIEIDGVRYEAVGVASHKWPSVSFMNYQKIMFAEMKDL